MFKKFISACIVAVMTISCGVISFAENNIDQIENSASKPIINEGKDIVIQYDDKGIYDMIQNIDDPVKKEMVISYWYTPAYYTTTKVDMQNQKALTEGVKTIKMLINTPTDKLEDIINQLLQKDVDRLVADSNIKIMPSFIKALEGKPIKKVNELQQKIGSEEGAVVVIDNTIESASMAPAATTSIVNGTVTANYTAGNSSGWAYLMINCVVSYSRDTSTYDITYLAPTTTTGYSFPYYVGDGYVVSEQGIIAGSTDRGYVHKSKSVWSIVNGWANSYTTGYILADVVIQGSGIVAKRYADYLTVQAYEGNGYTPGYSWTY